MDDLSRTLASARAGDRRAFEALARSQSGRLFAVAAAITGDAALAEDVVQEVFLRLLEGRFPPLCEGRAEAFLARVASRAALDAVRRRQTRRRREEGYALSQNPNDDTPLERLLTAELRQQVARAFGRLPGETRAALWLHLVEGETIEAAAAALGTNRSTLYRRIQGGTARLRELLRGRGFALPALLPWPDLLRELAPRTAPPGLIERLVALGAAPGPAPAALAGTKALIGGTLVSGKQVAVAAVLALLLLLLGAGILRSLLSTDGKSPGSAAAARAGSPSPAPAVAAVEAARPAPEPPAPAAESLPDPAPAGDAAAGEAVVVTGAVLHRESGAAIEGAAVRSGSAETLTGADGRFEIAVRPESGWITLEASAEGFAPETAGVALEEPEAVIALRPVLEMRGWVLDGEGNPLPGAVIDIGSIARGRSTTFRGDSPEGLARSAGDGSFRLTPWLFGQPRLLVHKPGYGGTFVLGVPPGASGLVIRVPRGATVSGRVVDGEGRPAPGRKLLWHTAWPEHIYGWRGEATSGAGGEFELAGLPAPARHRVRLDGEARPGVEDPSGLSYEVAVEPGEVVEGIELDAGLLAEPRRAEEPPADHPQLERPALRVLRFRGVVLGPQGQPVTRAHVRVYFRDGFAIHDAQSLSGAEGAFECAFRGLLNVGKVDEIRVEALHPSFAPERLELPAVMIDGGTDGEVAPEPIRITLTAGCSVRGTAAGPGGAPLEGVQLLLHEDQDQNDIRLAATTGQDGRFVLGRWNARNPPGLVLFHPDHVPLEVPRLDRLADGGTADLGVLRLIRGGTVEGVLRFADGTPARFRHLTVEGRRLLPPALTDGEGRFVLEQVPAGLRRLVVFHPDDALRGRADPACEPRSVEVVEGGHHAVELRLGR